MTTPHRAKPTTTRAAQASQAGRMLRIETTLDTDMAERTFQGDPLLLTKFDAEEGISIPYRYDIVMYRSTLKQQAHPIVPDMLLGTKALIHCRGEDENCEEFGLKLTRMGIFVTFEQLESDKPEDYVKFSARLVPPFRLLEFESGFRVWEQVTVLDVVKEVLITGTTIPIETLDFSLLESEQKKNPNAFPRLEYCVQFGEDSFNFVSRLLREYGIWYWFGCTVKDPDRSNSVIHNELMSFGRLEMNHFDNVKSQNFGFMRISKDPPEFAVDISPIDFGGNQGWTVSSWRRTYIPAPFVQFGGGNFNQMDPSEPIDASDQIAPTRDLLTRTTYAAYDRARIIRQIFPTPGELNDSAVANGVAKQYEGDKQYVDIRIDDGQSRTSVISGLSKNPTFMPGFVFITDADFTLRGEENKAFLLTRVQTSAFDLDYDFLTPGMVLTDVWNKSTSQLKAIDGSTATVGQGLQEWMQNWIEGQIDFFRAS